MVVESILRGRKEHDIGQCDEGGAGNSDDESGCGGNGRSLLQNGRCFTEPGAMLPQHPGDRVGEDI